MVAALATLLLLDDLLYPALAQPGGHSADRGENGLWLRYTWAFGQYTPPEVAALASRLRDGHFRYAYCHVRDVDRDGRLTARPLAQAQAFVNSLHHLAPNTRVLAWIYDAAQEQRPAANLADPAVRARMVEEAVWLVQERGFDGVQWDLENARSGDASLISLLRETRSALPPDSLVATCAYPWYPGRLGRTVDWEASYYSAVAAACDQIAVMDYDTGATSPRLYVWLTRQNVVQVTRAVARGNANCRVLLGVPTYGHAGWSHRVRAENLRLALKGVREGLADRRAVPGQLAGVAIFADYTTTDADWACWRRWWLDVSGR